jgi:hypothetical protein
MNSAQFILFFLTLACIPQGSQALQPQNNFDPLHYRHLVTSVSAGKHKNIPLTHFMVSNNTQWFLAKDDVQNGKAPFPINTEVFFTPGSENYCAHYLDASGAKKIVRIALTHKDSLPKIAKYEILPIKKQDGWFKHSTKYIRIFELTDNSQWIINPNSTCFDRKDDWQKGNKVLVSKILESGGTDWIMINTDQELIFNIPISWGEQPGKKTIRRRPLDLIVEPYSGHEEQIARFASDY